jgi:hypothetical protein
MKLKLLIALAVASGIVVAEESPLKEETFCPIETPEKVEQDYAYFSLGLGPMPLPLPTFAGGYRFQKGHHGADISLQVSTVVAFTEVKGSLLYLHYFKPSLVSECYVGGGIGTGGVFGCGEYVGIFSPEFVFGKQYRNESCDLRFFQAQISYPTIGINDSFRHKTHITRFPLVVISYGWGF